MEFCPAPKPKREPKKRPKPMRARSLTKRQPVAYEAAAVPKGERVRDPEHLAFVRSLPCIARGVDPTAPCGSRLYQGDVPSEACHDTNKGWTGGDNETFPGCPWHHDEKGYSWHVAGRVRFQKRFQCNIAKVTLTLYDATLARRGKGTP